MNQRKGISPIIAILVMVSVTLVLVFALVSWLMSLWGTVGATGALQITDAKLTTSELTLYITNVGNAEATINAISISGTFSTPTTDGTTTEEAKEITCNLGGISPSIKPGGAASVTCTISDGIVVGRIYAIKVITDAGEYMFYAKASSGGGT